MLLLRDIVGYFYARYQCFSNSSVFFFCTLLSILLSKSNKMVMLQMGNWSIRDRGKRENHKNQTNKANKQNPQKLHEQITTAKKTTNKKNLTKTESSQFKVLDFTSHITLCFIVLLSQILILLGFHAHDVCNLGANLILMHFP